MNKLIECSNEYDNITYERMQNENNLYTLKEQLSFEQEYYQRRQEEFEYLEKFHYDFNKEFNQNEFHNIVQQIRFVIILFFYIFSMRYFLVKIIKNSIQYV
jgi:hypothetical protein